MKENKGITLIALVITIIILIILAGVSLNMLVGEDGLIIRVKQAKEKIQIAQKEEEEALNALYYKMEEIGPLTIEKLKKEGTYVKGNTQAIDQKGNKVVIPDGFKVSEDSAINVSEGVVIEDNDKTVDGNGNQRGNQFVWIPTGNIIKADGTQIHIRLGRYTFAEDGTENLVQDAEYYKEEIMIETYYKELAMARISNGSDGINTTARNLKGFIESVKINKGYYIARYEASYRDGIRPYSKVSITANEENTHVDGKLWNWITQSESAKAAKAMYTNSNFETDLQNSYAWDTAISYIQKCSGDIDYSRQASLNTGIYNTGLIGDERCKIQDMASNMVEWTTECSTIENIEKTYPCVRRGGNCYRDNNYTSYRFSIEAVYTDYSVAFRPILYL